MNLGQDVRERKKEEKLGGEGGGGLGRLGRQEGGSREFPRSKCWESN